jgi:hypothetical protein
MVTGVRDRASVLEPLRLESCLLPDATLNTTSGIEPPSRLCSADESVPSPHRCQWVRWPVLPWALFPFKILYVSLLSLLGKDHGHFRDLGPGQPGASASTASESPPVIPRLVDLDLAFSSKLPIERSPSESVRRAESVSLTLAEAAARSHRPSWGL